MKNIKDNSRFASIDILKGFTVLLMIFFHFSFDLNYFKFIDIDILKGSLWYFLPRLIVFLFFFAVGMSLTLVHSKKIQWAHFWKRFFKLWLFAGIISLVTYFMFPQNWIYFGTLHSIAVISFMCLPFLKYPKLSLLLGLGLFIPSIIWDKTIPWPELPIQSFDYISPFPWVGAGLLGIFAISKNLHSISFPNNTMFNFLSHLGRHSLLIYLVHQPLLFGMIFAIFKIKN